MPIELKLYEPGLIVFRSWVGVDEYGHYWHHFYVINMDNEYILNDVNCKIMGVDEV